MSSDDAQIEPTPMTEHGLHTPSPDGRQIAARRLVIGALILYVVATTALSAYGVAVIRQNQHTIAGQQTQQSQVLAALLKQQDQVTQIAAQIRSCNVPQGACAKRLAAAQANATGSINEITEYAVVCADVVGSQSLEKVRLCVGRLLAQQLSQ